jgi:hypothetical protein
MIKELIAQLEAAGEGSRELDGLIWCWLEDAEFDRVECIPALLGTCLFYRKDGKETNIGAWPAYTTSTDAALGLVPPALGIMWDVAKYPGESAAAYVGPRDAPFREFVVARTPALAICIAALRAREGR